jgi:hypothetical protein
MPARVPIGNSSEGMFDNANSIEQAVTDKYGAPASEDFNAILTKVVASGDINDFHPSFKPATLAAVNDFNHFQGFPINGKITWYMQDKILTTLPY